MVEKIRELAILHTFVVKRVISAYLLLVQLILFFLKCGDMTQVKETAPLGKGYECSSHIWQLTIVCNFSSMAFNTLYCLLWGIRTYVHRETQTHLKRNSLHVYPLAKLI